MNNGSPAESPSRWPRRILVVALALGGFVLASYLAAYQAGWLSAVYEPFFGPGSRIVLQAGRASPIPDAALGAFAYALEAIGEAVGDEDRWRTQRLLVAAQTTLATLILLGSAGLVMLQVAVIRHLCTLCLASALLSLAIFLVVAREAIASWHATRKPAWIVPRHRPLA